MTEIFDIVDDNDNVIGQEERDIVHRDNLLHRAVHVLVFNDQNQMYLQKRAMSKDTNPGLWDTSVGGHLNTGETYDQAVIRETEEELGIKLTTPPERLFKLNPCEETGFEFIWIYKLIHNGEVTPCPIEIEQGEWMDYEQLMGELIVSPDLYTSSLLLIMEKM